MNQFNLGSFIAKFVDYSLSNFKGGEGPSNAPLNSDMKFQLPPEAVNQNLMGKTMVQSQILHNFNPAMMADLKMNHLASLERGLYIKDLMNLPKDLQEVLVLVQKNMAPTEELATLLTKNISLTALAELIQKGGKEAMSKLIMVMSEASKQGITDLSQIKEAMKLINASVSVAGQDNPNQVLKTFMLLYLPWLPLQEGVDFELEIESSQSGEDGSEISLTILISTRNYGNVMVTLILLGGNSLNIIVNCSELFPKEELLKRINTESKNHAMQSEVVFEQKPMKQGDNAIPQAKISMSNLKDVNPFLLLMANAIIRHTIDLDNQAG